MNGLDIALKLWPLITGFLTTVIFLVAYVLKIKSDSKEEHILLKGELDLMKQDMANHKEQNQKDHAHFNFIDEHLTKAGENIKDQLGGFIDIIGEVRKDIALTKQSIEGLTDLFKEMKEDLKKH